jgi:hypothetical protein
MTRICETLTFGVEIETVVPYATLDAERMRIGGYHAGIQVPYLPSGWKAERDASITSTRSGFTACEIVSPILQGAAGIAEVVEVIGILNAKGHRVNKSCGVHVHVGFRMVCIPGTPDADGSFEDVIRPTTSEELARLITLVSFLEKGLYAVTGTKARERSNWCISTKKTSPYSGDTILNVKQFLRLKTNEKYSILNIRPLTTDKKTVEFRVFSGSLDAVKVVGWIMVCLGIVEKALTDKRAMKWDAPDLSNSPTMGRPGAGATEVERLLFILGWGKKDKNYGWLDAGVEMKAIKAEFRRLAAKYDDATA